MRGGDGADAGVEFLARLGGDSTLLVGVLRRAVPVRFLELVASTTPWSGDARVLAAVVLNPRTPRVLSQRLVPSLRWRDLADVALSPRVEGALRVRAEAILKDQLPDLRLGERITLGRIATPVVLAPLLADPDPKVAQACLLNPRLREEDLLFALRQPAVPLALIQEAAVCAHWRDCYGVRLALVLQPRTPLAVALGQISSLLARDLERVAETSELPPLIQAAALRVARERPA